MTKPQEQRQTRETRETDILVIGSGAGALTAALTAKQLGADTEIIEKSHLWGGTSASSGGTLWIPCSRQMKAAGIEDSEEEAFSYIKALTGDDVADSKIRAYVQNASVMLNFIEDEADSEFRCVSYADYHMDLDGAKQNRSHESVPITAGTLGRRDYSTLQPVHQAAQAFGRVNWTIGEARPMITRQPGWLWTFTKVMARYYLDLPQRYRTIKDRRLTAGNALVGRLRVALNKRKVPLKLSTRLIDLIMEGGRCVGALVDECGQQVEIRAKKGVILGAGGFEHNAKMRAENLPAGTVKEWSASQQNNTGDAILAAQKVGAKLDLMNEAWWSPTIRLGDEDRARPMFVERALPGCIIVNQKGNRYMNESASYNVAGGEMLKCNNDESSTTPSWFVFDAKYRGRYAVGPIMPGPSAMDRTLKPSIREILYVADTIEALAEKINADSETLKTTVSRFNEYAKEGQDPDFQRGVNGYDRYYGDPSNQPNPCLASLDKGPFYALKIFPGDIGTKGGLLTNENAQVLNENDQPIAGLYAIGNTSASVMGASYPGAGSTLGPAMTFGHLAARHMIDGEETH